MLNKSHQINSTICWKMWFYFQFNNNRPCTIFILIDHSFMISIWYIESIFRWFDPSLQVFAVAELPVWNVCLHFDKVCEYVIFVFRDIQKKSKSGWLTVLECPMRRVRWTYRGATLRMITNYFSAWEAARMATYSRSDNLLNVDY